MEKKGCIVAFDGLSLAGKSTMVQMLFEKSEDAEVIRENVLDPYRPAISKLNKLLKECDYKKAVAQTAHEFPYAENVLALAQDYASQFSGNGERQALLAYMFASGRKIVNKWVQKAALRRDVILDRWMVSGMAYQADPTVYSWREIQELNKSFDIIEPDVQIILTCPIQEIPVRRAYRDKQIIGTAGQMSKGREHFILASLLDIYETYRGNGNFYLFENNGTPVRDLKTQVQQAALLFQVVEGIVGNHGFKLISDEISSEEFFCQNPLRLVRIYDRQTT